LEEAVQHAPLALVMSQRAVSRELSSARPDAPVVPYREATRTASRTWHARTVVAEALHRVARAVEPAGCELAR
jgi:hypothetical protein